MIDDELLGFVRSRVDPQAAWELTAKLCRVGPEGADQLIGSPWLDKRIDLLIEELRERGFDPRVQRFLTDVHEPRQWSLSILADEERRIDSLPIRYSVETPPEGIEAEVVQVGPGFEEDYETAERAGIDPRGKIVLLDNYTILAKSRMVTAWLHGAVGAILVNHYDHDYHGFMAGGWHRPHRALRRGAPLANLKYPLEYAYFKFMDETLPRIPVLTVRASVGRALHERAAAGNLRVRMTWRKSVRRCETRNVWVYLRGGRFPDEIVMSAGHIDSYHHGARDDVSECVRLISAAEIFRARAEHAQARGQGPARSLLLAFWSGEEASMLGSYAFLSEHPEIAGNVVAYLNADGSAMYGGDRWLTGGSALLRRPALEASRAVLDGQVEPEWKATIGAGSDHSVFLFDGGIPVLDRLPGWYRPVTNYHDNISDTVDTIEPETFRKPIEVLVLLLDRFANAERLPYDLPAAADFLDNEVARLAEPARRAGVDLEPVCAAIARLRVAAERLDTAPPGDDDRLRATNALLARVVAPRLNTLSYDTDGVMPISLPGLAALAYPDRLPEDRRRDLRLAARLVADTLDGLAAILTGVTR